ncbi:head GIN domain-containing protein [Flavobacterium sp.]|uniref:head GIN domain-containing protein n=1 Tax=Flavobacterium sp. TaxID=239 RepID=UPI0011F5E5B4|nr:head GIN domain-containing protein [Flavobacterium sp.]RZJ69200.1 MAG: DUF2807 domain-containing protein [Flavobacterium sp.]
MKNIVKSITTIAAALAFLTTSSCVQFNDNEIVGSGNVKTETRKINGPFDSVKSERGLDVVIVQSDEVSVVIEADDNLLPKIETKLDGKTLVITTEFNSYSNVSSKKITVKMPTIKGLEAESGSTMTSEGNLRSEKLELTSSSGSNLKVSVEADKLTADSSSGSGIEVSGKALNFSTSSSSGSHVTAGDLLANEIAADASSGSSILVHPILKLSGEASSGGSVKYNNEPKSFTKDESSGGSVSKE